MVEVWLPYGETEVVVKVPDENLKQLIEPNSAPEAPNARQELRRAIENPIGTQRLDSLASPNDRVAIVVDDSTRGAPTTLMMEELLDVLCRCGVKEEDVTMIVGVGTHRPATSGELSKLAGSYVGRIRTVSHDCNASKLRHVGTTTRGNAIELNELYVNADLKILTGDVEFHYYAGYGGGRKSILPAIAGAGSIQRNHSLLLHPQAKAGVLKGNPVSEDMREAAEFARPDFILNVVMNSAGDITKAYAGDLEKAFLEGVALVDRVWKVPVEQKVDIIVVSAGGAPRDVNLYQAYKGLHNSLDALSDGGAAILVAECQEGDGNQVFREWMTRFRDSKEMEKEVRERFRLGGHKAYYLMKALEKAKIYLVSTMPDFYVSNIFRMRSSRTVNTALQSAFRAVGRDSKVTVMPYGSITLPVLT